MSDKFFIQKSTDVALARELHSKTFPTDNFDTVTGSSYWIVWHKGVPVGFCSVREFSKSILFLSRAGLLPEARSKGLHTRMIRARTRWAKRNGFKAITTYATIENIRSTSNLEKCGFKRYVPAHHYAGRGVLYYLKEL